MDKSYSTFLADAIVFVREGIKVCSFSERQDSIIMWSHYADEHRGFCIEYDMQTIALDDLRRRMLFPMIYTDKLFDATKYFEAAMTDAGKFNNIFPILSAIYKSSEWAYEKEWRLVFPFGIIPADSEFGMPTASRVFLGSWISEADSKTLQVLCRRRKIGCLRMKLRNDSFALESRAV
jgi:hypothetical protein